MINPLAQKTFTVRRAQKPSYTFHRYSNDGGKTFTEAKAVIEHMGEVYVDKKSGKDYTVVNVENRIPVDLVEAGLPYTVVWEAKSEDTQTDKAAIMLHSAKWGMPVQLNFTPAKGYKAYARTFIMPDFAKEGTYFFLRFDSNKVKTEGVTDRLYGRAFRIYRGQYTLDTISQLIGTTPGSWMGTVTWDKPYPPFDVTAYTWSKIKGEDGAPGTPAELYRLKAITERAVVNEEGMLSVALQYAIEHTVGNNVTTLSASVGGYRVRWHGDNGTPGNSYLTDGDRPSATYTMAGYHNNQHRPSAVVAELVKGNTILDVKTVPVVFDAAASVTTAKDLSAITTTVQGHSKTLLGQAQQISNLVVGLDGIKGSVQSVEGSLKNYSTLEQTANGFKLMAKAVQQGLRNLLKGGNLHTTYYSYGMAESLTIDLEGGHTYTMTANGHVSQRIKDRHMDMRVMIFNKEWTHLKIIVIDSTTDTTASVTWDDMPTGQYFINAFPMPNDANNRDTITLNWVTVTEGNVPMSQWRTTEAEEDEAWVGMGIDRKNKSIDMHADKFSLHNTKGEQILGMNKDGDMEVKGTVEASVLLRKFAFIDLPVEPYGRTLTYDKEHTKVTGYTERIPPDIIVLRKIGPRPKEDAPTLYLPYAGHCKNKMIDIYGPTSFGYFGAFFIKAILNDAYFPDGELELNGYIEGDNGFFTINGEKIAAPRYDGHSFALLGTDGYNRIQVEASGGENPTISMVKLQSVEKDNGQWVWAIFDMRNCTLK